MCGSIKASDIWAVENVKGFNHRRVFFLRILAICSIVLARIALIGGCHGILRAGEQGS